MVVHAQGVDLPENDRRRHEPSQRPLLFKNVGPTALPITSVNWTGTEHYFSETNTCGTSVPAKLVLRIQRPVQPVNVWNLRGDAVDRRDPDPSGPQRITVMGTGVAGADGTKLGRCGLIGNY